jgi:predicted RNA binding protein YcfA (HicA-like mRNA interferase family)
MAQPRNAKLEPVMSANRLILGLTVAAGVAASVALLGSTVSDAENKEFPDHAQHMRGSASTVPAMPGQEAFGTIQEIVRILEADPTTDWSKVDIKSLREHLIDMHEVTMQAAASERALGNGVEIVVTGEGRTLEAIKHMLPAHVHELDALGWNAGTETLPDGIKLVVTSEDPEQVIKLRALGFMGIMVQGAHHQMHHLMMARGEFTHH